MANQVLEIIKQRHYTGSRPGKRLDSYKLGLAVEGGGMRGMVSGGALAALESLNLKSAFDVVYGSSCGAYASSYFVAGNTLMGSRFYLDYSQRQLVSRWRALTGGRLFDLDYVRDKMHADTPLNYHEALRAKPPLHVVSIDAKSGRPVTFKGFKTAKEFDRALKASASIPPYYHPRPFKFRRRRVVDAATLDPFCIHSAIGEGCSHILVLFSMPWRNRHSPKIIDRRVIAPYLSRINHHLAELYLKHDENSVNGLNHLWSHYDGTHILTLAPAKGHKLPGQLTTNRKRLASGFLAGAEAALNIFAPDDKTTGLILNNLKLELKI